MFHLKKKKHSLPVYSLFVINTVLVQSHLLFEEPANILTGLAVDFYIAPFAEVGSFPWE